MGREGDKKGEGERTDRLINVTGRRHRYRYNRASRGDEEDGQTQRA